MQPSNSKRFVKVLTEKGLRFIVSNGGDADQVAKAKAELRRRGLKANIAYRPELRDLDGYERDRK
jgi:hypothetical protein